MGIPEEHSQKPVRRWLRLSVVAILAAAILIILAVMQPWNAASGPQDTVVWAYDALDGLQSYRARVTVGDDTASEGTLEIAFVAPDRYHFKQAAPEETFMINSIVTDGTQYVRSGYSYPGELALITGMLSSLLTRESTLGWLRWLTDIRELGEKSIDGESLPGYIGKVDSDKWAARTQQNLEMIRFRQGSGYPTDTDIAMRVKSMRAENYEITFWIGKENFLIRQLIIHQLLTGSGGQPVRTNWLTFRYRDINEPVTIELPHDAQGNLLPGWETWPWPIR
ncbi:MAG: hypothetical protein HYX84_08495 [Chloroflexi bacterium]|nr:hypothetical protein [Chloroflexota bacterium]